MTNYLLMYRFIWTGHQSQPGTSSDDSASHVRAAGRRMQLCIHVSTEQPCRVTICVSASGPGTCDHGTAYGVDLPRLDTG